jgi:DNA-directed RNA polymerase specialized sigma24 family protein
MSPPADPTASRSALAAFDALLLRLAADDEAPAEAYEHLRQRLIALFRLHVASEAEALADDTLDRVGRRLCEGIVVEHVPAYVHGVARLVLLEATGRPSMRRAAVEALEQLPAPEPEPTEDDEPARVALRACLAQLGATSSRLILAYYGDDGAGRIAARQKLAVQLGLKLNALRNRALRLRSALETCVRTRLRDGIGRNGTSAKP